MAKAREVSPNPPTAGQAPDELASALTDLLVAIVAAGLATSVPVAKRRRRRRIASGFRWFFGATAAAAGSGAALHGLFRNRQHPLRRALWRFSLASIGLAALAGWRTGAALAIPARQARGVERLALAAHGAFAAVVLTRDVRFVAAVGAYAPASGFLAWAFASRLNHPRERDGAALGLVGLATTGSAAVIQVLKIRLHPRFDANATYHAIQAVGILVLAASARRLVHEAQPRR